MAQQLPVVALVGRPNVGKSTLFNRLTKSRDALVADRPGVTRDRQYGYGRQDHHRFIVVDTGGIGQDDAAVDARALVQTEDALAQADAIVFVVDARDGLTGTDADIAERLRRCEQPVHVAVNKSEGLDRHLANAEFHAFGLGEPWAISAERGDRVAAMMNRILAAMTPRAGAAGQDAADDEGIRLALIGRPNAGKSTLVNRLLGEERMLAMDEPGTTRDAIASAFRFDDEPWVIVDTAGIRRRSRVRDSLERLTVIKAMQSAEGADVVILLVDARRGLSTQDIRLLSLVQERGRAAVIAVNKWDGLDQAQREKLRADLIERMGAFDYLPLCFISALHGSGLRELLEAARQSHHAATAELPTPALTRALNAAVDAHPPPAIHGRRIKLRFAHQGGRKPPTVIIHGNRTQHVNDEYKRYLERRFRQDFNLYGTPIRLFLRSNKNPYD